jgi:CheY-like chemotaxis protein
MGVRTALDRLGNFPQRGTTLHANMPRTLLVIDDNKSVRDSLRFLLERRGYRAVTAESGGQGLALAREQVIDGALIDVNMPVMNGIATCQALKALAAELGRPVAIWMITGARTPHLTRASLEAGALALLGKPFDLAELFRGFEGVWGPSIPSEAMPAPTQTAAPGTMPASGSAPEGDKQPSPSAIVEIPGTATDEKSLTDGEARGGASPRV